MDKTPPRIAEQAAEYVARRAGGTPQPTRDGLEDWLGADARHAAAYDDTQALWAQLKALEDDDGLQRLKHRRLGELARERTGRIGTRLWAVAAVLVLVLGGGYLLQQPGRVLPVPVQYATVLGEQRTEALADGSQVVLNTATTLQASFDGERREIELLQGEAQFDVAKDAQRPFVVRVGEGRVTALGTRFQVRRGDEGAVVTLLEGSVEIVHGHQRRTLVTDEQARLTPAGELVVARIDPETVDGWLDGWLRFRATPLAEVIAEANRYSTRKLRLGDPKLAQVELNGNFRAGNSQAIANAAEMILPVRVEARGEELVLLPR